MILDFYRPVSHPHSNTPWPLFSHVNDVHAHLDQYRKSGTDCDPPSTECVGGYPRIKSKVDDIRSTTPDTLLLNMGDEFQVRDLALSPMGLSVRYHEAGEVLMQAIRQGTLFYSFYGGTKIAETVNELGFDAMTIGNVGRFIMCVGICCCLSGLLIFQHEFDGGDDRLAAYVSLDVFPLFTEPTD